MFDIYEHVRLDKFQSFVHQKFDIAQNGPLRKSEVCFVWKIKVRTLIVKPMKVLIMNIGWTTPKSSGKHFFFFVLIRSNISLLRPEKMLWFYSISVFIKSLEFPPVDASNLEFHWLKV